MMHSLSWYVFKLIERLKSWLFILLAFFPLVRFKKNFSFSKGEGVLTFTLVWMQLCRSVYKHGSKMASYSRMSVPVCSQANVWPGATYDASLQGCWNVDRKNLKASIPASQKLLFFVADIACRHGYLMHAWTIYQSLKDNSNNKQVELVARIGILDILCIVSHWKFELKEYYRRQIWFDPDRIDKFQDSLTCFFAKSGERAIKECFEHICYKYPSVPDVYEIMGEYFELTMRPAEALLHYRQACESGGGKVAFIRKKNMEDFIGGHISRDKALVDIMTISEIASAWKLPSFQLHKSATSNVSYDLFLRGLNFKMSINLEHAESDLVQLCGAIPLEGGIVLTEHEGKRVLVRESKNLDGKHFKLFSPEVVSHDNSQALLLKPAVKERRDVGYLIPGLGWNYYHWLFEVVPLLEFYIDNHLEKEGIPLVFQFDVKHWHLETLQLLGLKNIIIAPYTKGRIVEYKNAFLPSASSRKLIPSVASIDFLRKRLAKPKNIKIGKKVYISRNHVRATRSTRNALDLQKKHEMEGYSIIDPSNLSLEEQIDFFSDVEAIAGEGGAGLTNLIFCPSGIKVTIYSGERSWAETFSTIASALDQRLEVRLGSSHPIPNPYYLWTAFDVTEFSSDIVDKERPMK